MFSRSEMPIPRSRGETFVSIVFTFIVVFFTVLGVYNLLNQTALIPTCIWLALVFFITRDSIANRGGIRKSLVDWLGSVAGRQFVEIPAQDDRPREMCFGFQLFGRRFIQRRIELAKVESVEWTPGQATSMAGRDMDDWLVGLWFDHVDPAGKIEGSRKPDQDLHTVGRSGKKKDTEEFGISFVDFLNKHGTSLMQVTGETRYVRGESRQW